MRAQTQFAGCHKAAVVRLVDGVRQLVANDLIALKRVRRIDGRRIKVESIALTERP